MNRILEKGEQLYLNNSKYLITGLAGTGASCVVYTADRISDNTKHLLKEYNPRRFELSREDNGELELDTCDEETITSYYDGLRSFKYGAEKQIKLRNEISELTNQTSNIQNSLRRMTTWKISQIQQRTISGTSVMSTLRLAPKEEE